MTAQEKHSQLITLGPGCYFLITVWIQILGSRPADVKALSEATAISSPTVRKYLSKLRALGYVLPAGDRWQLAGNQAQLEFMASDGDDISGVVPVIDLQVEDDQPETESSETLETVDKTGEIEPLEKKNFFSPINIINKESLIKDSINNNSGEKKFFPDESGNDDNQGVIDALQDCGIQLNVRTKALIGAITERDIRREWLKLRDYGRQHETGLLITILEGVAAKNERMAPGHGYADWET